MITGFLPMGEEFVHQCMETGIVTGFQQVAKLMNHHMFDTPFWQKQQIDRETDGLVLDIADAPSRNHCLVRNNGWFHVHFL